MNSVRKSYMVKNRNHEVLADSRSGGVFSAISDYVLQEKGVVYGCIMDEFFQVYHVRAANETKRNAMRKSKYVQSNIQNVFLSVKEDLENQKLVLFSGTPCETSAVRAYLSFQHLQADNIILMDIVCHGVPSPLIFEEYISWLEGRYKSKVLDFEFRDKIKYGWKDHVEKIVMKNKVLHKRVFTELFYSHTILRESCFKCPYKSIYRESDITIADGWGIEKINKEMDDDKGVSLVLINTELGEKIFNKCRDNLKIIECRIEDCMQEPLKRPCVCPQNRYEFWHDYYNKGFNFIVKKYGKNDFMSNLKLKLPKQIKDILKR